MIVVMASWGSPLRAAFMKPPKVFPAAIEMLDTGESAPRTVKRATLGSCPIAACALSAAPRRWGRLPLRRPTVVAGLNDWREQGDVLQSVARD